jgi:hypothetical protein
MSAAATPSSGAAAGASTEAWLNTIVDTTWTRVSETSAMRYRRRSVGAAGMAPRL